MSDTADQGIWTRIKYWFIGIGGGVGGATLIGVGLLIFGGTPVGWVLMGIGLLFGAGSVLVGYTKQHSIDQQQMSTKQNHSIHQQKSQDRAMGIDSKIGVASQPIYQNVTQAHVTSQNTNRSANQDQSNILPSQMQNSLESKNILQQNVRQSSIHNTQSKMSAESQAIQRPQVKNLNPDVTKGSDTLQVASVSQQKQLMQQSHNQENKQANAEMLKESGQHIKNYFSNKVTEVSSHIGTILEQTNTGVKYFVDKKTQEAVEGFKKRQLEAVEEFKKRQLEAVEEFKKRQLEKQIEIETDQDWSDYLKQSKENASKIGSTPVQQKFRTQNKDQQKDQPVISYTSKIMQQRQKQQKMVTTQAPNSLSKHNSDKNIQSNPDNTTQVKGHGFYMTSMIEKEQEKKKKADEQWKKQNEISR